MTWTDTGVAAEEVPEGGLREVDVGGRPVLLVRAGSQLYATSGRCAHQQGLLADGWLEGSRLTCPDHNAVFDVRTGTVLADPFGIEPPAGGCDPLATFPVKAEGGRIWVDLTSA